MIELQDFKSYEKSVPRILDTIHASKIFSCQACILLKPNLVNASTFPVTTSPELCRALITYIKRCTNARIILAEGCGDDSHETDEVFNILGYDKLADEFGIELMDLNYAPLTRLTHLSNRIFPEIFLPKIAFNSFIVSLPVLKAHSLAGITGTLKNMMGFAPPRYYSGGGMWKKSFFHAQMQDSIIELCRYRTPDLTLMDASIGLPEYHLGGPVCDPGVGKLLAGDDPFRLDQRSARLLDLDPDAIRHIHQGSSAET